jgi:hypothetical protein
MGVTEMLNAGRDRRDAHSSICAGNGIASSDGGASAR